MERPCTSVRMQHRIRNSSAALVPNVVAAEQQTCQGRADGQVWRNQDGVHRAQAFVEEMVLFFTISIE